MIALIMAGGSGTRFWPASRNRKPKQFLKIAGEKSMIQLTVERLKPLMNIQDIYVVTAQTQAQMVQEHLPFLPPENIIIEPFGMNTAACIALSVEYLEMRYAKDTTMVVLPADHVIKKEEAFVASLKQADIKAKSGGLITFGILPEYPATGYGYIEAGDAEGDGSYQVSRFKEKPDFATAEAFIKEGNFYWNSGMFAWTLESISAALNEHLPVMAELAKKIRKRWETESFEADIGEIYAEMPRLPIDIGIMEKARQRYVIPVELGWSDVGSFKALYDISAKDAAGNSISAAHLAMKAKNNYISTGKFTAIIGVEGLCVVESEDAILICPLDKSEEVKKVVDHLKETGKEELL